MTYVIFIYLSPKNRVNGEELLIIPCEIAVKSVIPAVKALMAEELVEKHGLKQDEVAEILGISQSAVSKYTRKVRGHVIKIEGTEEIQAPLDNVITLLVNRTSQRTEFLTLFCQICRVIREKRLMCELCQKTDPAIEKEECDFCLVNSNSKRGV